MDFDGRSSSSFTALQCYYHNNVIIDDGSGTYRNTKLSCSSNVIVKTSMSAFVIFRPSKQISAQKQMRISRLPRPIEVDDILCADDVGITMHKTLNMKTKQFLRPPFTVNMNLGQLSRTADATMYHPPGRASKSRILSARTSSTQKSCKSTE